MSSSCRNGCAGLNYNIHVSYITNFEFHISGNDKARSSHVCAMLSDKRAQRAPQALLVAPSSLQMPTCPSQGLSRGYSAEFGRFAGELSLVLSHRWQSEHAYNFITIQCRLKVFSIAVTYVWTLDHCRSRARAGVRPGWPGRVSWATCAVSSGRGGSSAWSSSRNCCDTDTIFSWLSACAKSESIETRSVVLISCATMPVH